jgi:hypothetical protein
MTGRSSSWAHPSTRGSVKRQRQQSGEYGATTPPAEHRATAVDKRLPLPKTPATTPPKHHQHPLTHTPTLTTETHTTNSTPHPHPNTTPHRQFSALHPHTPHHPRTRHLCPHSTPHTARSTTHPEKSTAHAPDTRPNARHLSTRPTHNTRSIATPHTPTHATPRSAPHSQNPNTASPPTQNRSSSNETPPPAPNAATTATTTAPTTQATATHPCRPKPRVPKTPSARATCPAGCACDAHAQESRKTPARPIPPDDTNLQPSPTRALHAPAPQATPVATPCAVATSLWASTLGRYTPADAPALKAPPVAGRTSASLGACARSRPCAAHPACPTLWCRPVRRRHTAVAALGVLRR